MCALSLPHPVTLGKGETGTHTCVCYLIVFSLPVLALLCVCVDLRLDRKI